MLIKQQHAIGIIRVRYDMAVVIAPATAIDLNRRRSCLGHESVRHNIGRISSAGFHQNRRMAVALILRKANQLVGCRKVQCLPG